MQVTEQEIREHNAPEAFDALPTSAQAVIRMWVRLALEPAQTFRVEHGRWHSYNLKHHCEAAVGFYVGNGEMKGAMLAEGYREYHAHGDHNYPDINWTFKARRRCPHRLTRAGFNCPLFDRYSMYAGNPDITYASLCQATPHELEDFDYLCRVALHSAA